MGVIDSISEGLLLVRRRPLLMVVPAVVDLALWLAPQFSIEPMAASVAAGLQASAAAAGPQAADSVQAVQQMVLQFGEQANLLGLISSGFLGVPSLVAAGMPEGIANLGGRVSVGSPFLALGLALPLAILGLLVAAVYLSAVAVSVRGEALGSAVVIARAGKAWLRLIVLAVAALVAFFALVMPVTVFVSLVSLLSPTIAAFLTSLVGLMGLWLGLWVLFYLFFVVDAMMLHEVGLQRAIINSIIVVRSSFWSAIGFIVLINVLAAGLSVVWRWLALIAPGGLAVAIAGNSFVGSGLIAASFIFYKNRYDTWRQRVLERGGQ